MAAHNRYLRGAMSTMRGTVRGNITVEPGDFVVIDNTVGTCGLTSGTLNSTADNRFYPFEFFRCTTAATGYIYQLASQFVGVAMTGSESGTTNDIVVATSGVFRYPVIGAPSAVTVGAKVSAVSPAAGAGGGISNQTVCNHNTATGHGSTAYLGHIVKTESGASYVDFQLWSGLRDGVLT